MYRSILVAVENSPADRTILTHVRELATLTGAELLLVHVADGWAARNFDQLKLRESEEMKADRAYLQRLASELTARSLKVQTELAMGDPATELIRLAEERKVDLDRDVHARPSLLQRPAARDDRQQGPARRQDSRLAASRAITRAHRIGSCFHRSSQGSSARTRNSNRSSSLTSSGPAPGLTGRSSSIVREPRVHRNSPGHVRRIGLCVERQINVVVATSIQ